jgi:hypothetical protein
MSTRGDFDFKAGIADCGNPVDAKTDARANAISTNKSLRMVLPSLRPFNHFRLYQDSSLSQDPLSVNYESK